MKEGYESDVVKSDDSKSASEDEDFDVNAEASRTQNDDSDDEFAPNISVASRKTRYRTRNAVDKQNKRSADAKTKEATKNNTLAAAKIELTESDEENAVRPRINYVPTSSMPSDSSEDEDGEPKKKSIRRFFGKNEAVYIMDAKKTGNIGRYFNVSLLFANYVLLKKFLKFLSFFTAFLQSKSVCTKCFCRYA